MGTSNPSLPLAEQGLASSKKTLPLDQRGSEVQTKAFVIAWAFTVIFYFLEYAVRSSPAVMIRELETLFRTTVVGVSAILGIYYYTYSTMSWVAGAALDHLGAKRTVPVGVAILGIGCLLFSLPSVFEGNVGRLLQGAASSGRESSANIPQAWEASILPLYDARSSVERVEYTQPSVRPHTVAISFLAGIP